MRVCPGKSLGPARSTPSPLSSPRAHRLHVRELLQALGQALQLRVVPELLLFLLLNLIQQETPEQARPQGGRLYYVWFILILIIAC